MPPGTVPPIPADALADLEDALARYGVTVDGWDACPPLYVTPPPDGGAATFDPARVARVVRALTLLRHTKGRWAGKPLIPAAWQAVWIIAPVFGWVRADGTRLYRRAFIEVPRKAGKSTLASGLALVLLAADDEQGAEVYAAASSREQARIVFDEASRMAQRSPVLRRRLRAQRHVILAPSTGGKFAVLSKLAEAAHGLNVHGAVVDELHVHKRRDLVDAIETGTGAREQPLVIIITTADEGDETTIYAERHNEVVNAASGAIVVPDLYGAVWAAPHDADPYAEATWRAAHPGIGISTTVGAIGEKAEQAKQTPSFLPTFQRLYLNQRVRSESRWLRLVDWDACASPVDEAGLGGAPCWGGLDLASVRDFSSLCWVFEAPDADADADDDGGGLIALWRFWLPVDTLIELDKRTAGQASRWAREGAITVTPGAVQDHRRIVEAVAADAERFAVQSVAYDRWSANPVVSELVDAGVEMVPLGQGFASMSAPMKELERLVASGRFRHGGNRVARWMAGNVVAVADPAGNLKPDKSRSGDHIDGMVAAIMATDRWMRRQTARSVYDDDGPMVF